MSTLLPMAGARSDKVAIPIFDRIAIIGFGLIGGSLALAVRERWPSALIVAVDRREVIETAMRMHAADVGGDDVIMAADAQLIVLAAPVRANIEILSRLPEYIPGEAVVTDVGSTKREIAAAALSLPDRLRFVGGHPLAGAAVSGVEAARGDLFAARPWILTPAARAGDEAIAKVSAFVAAIGARVQTMSPEAHDTLVAYLSHLPQLAASALMQLVGEQAGAGGLALAGRGLRDTTRLASSPGGIWRDITASNHDNISRAIDELVAILLALKPSAGEPAAALDRTFDAAAQWKRVLEQAAERS